MATPPHETPDYASACTRIGDFEVHYLSAEPPGGAAPEKDPVLLLHGFGAWAEVVWSGVIPALARERRVVAPDLIGFGHSAKPGHAFYDSPEPLEPGVRWLEAFMDAAGMERAVVVGNSFGGGLALHMAATRPHRVSRLVLSNSMGLGRTIHPVYKALCLPRLGTALLKPDRRLIRRMWHTIVHDPALVTEDVIERNYELLCEPGAAEIYHAARLGVALTGQRIRLEDALPRVTQPTLLVWGERDRVFPVRHARRAVKRIPDARLAVLEDCGHIPPFECPDRFADVVAEFLRDVDVGRTLPPLPTPAARDPDAACAPG